MNLDSVNGFLNTAINTVMRWTPTVLGALITLFVGMRVIKQITKLAKKGFSKSHLDITVSKFLANLLGIALKILLIVSVAGMFGIQTTSFVAMIGAAGLAIGLSLQGSLQNFAGGVLILVFKPYQVGDIIEVQEIIGKVEMIDLLFTRMVTPENKTAIIPNGDLADGNIINYSKRGTIRVDVPVGIGYGENIDQAKNALQIVLNNESTVLKNPEPVVAVKGLGDSSVNLVLRYHTLPEHYFTSPLTVVEQAKKALDAASIEIPFPQRVVHMVKETSKTI